jgi:hypothetical protein
MSAADLTTGDGAGEVGVFTLFTVGAFWLAHSYSSVLGKWSSEGVTPTLESAKAILNKELPMVAAPLVPINILVFGSFLTSADGVLINIASGVCVLELAATSYFSARRGGAGTALAAGASLVASAFGVSIILLKLLLHG